MVTPTASALRPSPAAGPAAALGTVLVANRGEIAIRICRACSELGIQTVAVYAEDDAQSLHTKKADVAVPLTGAGFGAAAYLNQEALLAAAAANGCRAVHCGYGFLSENADFVAACEDAGLVFIGPPSTAISLFGDKTRARALAQELGVALLPGTVSPVTLAEARDFFASLGGEPMMIKALAGGGGRGMRTVFSADELEDAYERCCSEAVAAFGDGAVFVEKLMVKPRHIEVQVLADGQGGVTHLFERECSIQRQNQKLIEIAPSPSLPPGLRSSLLEDAVKLVSAANYKSAATVEFLVDREMTEDSAFAFMEVNPRLQVEHTVTEGEAARAPCARTLRAVRLANPRSITISEVCDIDIVQTQLRIAAGASLADLGLDKEAEAPSGFAIQCRVNLETMQPDCTSLPSGGTLTQYEEPGGRGVRVDAFGYAGYQCSTNYDSMLAKVICHSGAPDYESAVSKTYRALREFQIAGVQTNIPFLLNMLANEQFRSNDIHTGFIADNIDALLDITEEEALHFEAPAGEIGEVGDAIDMTGLEGTEPLPSPMESTIVEILVEEGETILKNQVNPPSPSVRPFRFRLPVTKTGKTGENGR